MLSKAALRERFEPTSNREFYKMEFRSPKRKETESWADFGDTLLLLVDRAFPDLSDDAREALALDRFMSQLNPQQVSLAVKQRKPKCVREAVDAALEVESYLIAWHRYDREKQHNEAVREDRIFTTVASSTHLQQLERIVETLKDIQLRLMNCETTQKTTQQSQSRDTSHQSHTVICRKCKQMGHYARGCAFKWQKRWRPSPPNDKLHNVPALCVNSVMSYYLQGQISGVSVPFLVDTGAGVSLLNGRIWDQARFTNVRISPAPHSNLVGVDGHPIHFREVVTIPLTISSTVFNQEFVIADNITAEGILGMDFLEEHKCILDMAKRQVTVNQSEPLSLVPIVTNSVGTPVNVTVNKTVTIPPASEMEILGRLPAEGGPWLIEGIQQKCLVARSVVIPANNTIPVRIANTSTLPVTLHQGMKVATAELVDETHINGVVETDSEHQQSTNNEEGMILNVPLSAELTETQREKFFALLSHYENVLAKCPEDLGPTSILSHHIETGDVQPIRQQARRVPLPHRRTVQDLLKGMLEKRVISPSKSPWALPIVLVKKKDGTTRFWVDYRKVNDITRKDAYPIPRVDDTLDTLLGSAWFTTLDLKSGYWQVEVAEEHREKTAFCTQEGLFEFNVMPFGLCNAPATFQRLMNSILAGLQWTTCLVYIDDM